jgi:hypothetical protein
MNVYNIDGKKIKWKLNGYALGHIPEKLCSQYHIKCKSLLQELFAVYSILEEIPVPDLGLTLDFFIPMKKLAIEVDGQQHDKFVPFFHGNKQKFAKGKTNDRLKEYWCELNNITIIRLKWDEEDTWKNQLSKLV